MPTHRAQRGFTLLELVTVLVMVGALAVVALPRLPDLNGWRLRAFSDQLVAELQTARRQALNQRQPLLASFSSGGLTVTDASGATRLSLPCPSAVPQCLGGSVPASVRFNANNSGSVLTSTGLELSLSVQDGNTVHQRLRIAPETGLIRVAH